MPSQTPPSHYESVPPSVAPEQRTKPSLLLGVMAANEMSE